MARHGKRGFAFIWVLVSVALAGLGLAVGTDVYLTQLRREKERELLFVGSQFRTAIARYRETRLAGGRQEYPAALEDLLQDRRFPDMRRYLRRVQVDPMTGRAEWGVVRVAGRIVGVHSLSEAVPIKVDGFDAGDRGFRGKQKYNEWVFTYPPDLLLGRAGGGVAPPPEGAASAAPLQPSRVDAQHKELKT